MIAQSEFEEVFVISGERATFRLQVIHPNQGQPLKQETTGPQARHLPISAEAGILSFCVVAMSIVHFAPQLGADKGQAADKHMRQWQASVFIPYFVPQKDGHSSRWCTCRTAITSACPIYVPLGILTGNSIQGDGPAGHA